MNEMKDDTTQELYEVIRGYNVPHEDSGAERNESARKALVAFHEKLKAVKPEEWYNPYDGYDLFYMHFIMILRQALIDKNYEIACNEMGSLIYRYPISEQRIRAMILHTLERYL